MRTLGFILLSLSIVYFAFTRFTPIHSYLGNSIPELETDYATTDARLLRYSQSKSLPEGGAEELIDLKEKQKWRGQALFCQNHRLDTKALWFLLIGGALSLFHFVRSWISMTKNSFKPKSLTDTKFDQFVAKEEYVDEWELKRKLEDGFPTREEAIDWMDHDPLLNCDYCGSRLKSTMDGSPESLEFVTYYKKVPGGAKDMRIVLGSRWKGKAATELKCSGCDRLVKR